jgi:hypothetical protein
MVIAKGQPMLAQDIIDLKNSLQGNINTLSASVSAMSFFPKGTILMYDGTSWTDNVTLKGWYKCEGQTVDGYGTLPNLKNRFVIGYDASTPARTTGGSNTIEKTIDIATANLPAHSHSLKNEDISITGGSHGHTLKNEDISITGGSHGHSFKNESIATDNNSAGHTHTFTTGDPNKTLTAHFGLDDLVAGIASGDMLTIGSNWDYDAISSASGNGKKITIDATHKHTGTTDGISANHTHSFNLNGKSTNDNTSHSHTLNLNGKSTNDSTTHTHTLNLNGKSTNTTGSGTGIALSFDNRPQYYALIYIIKVTAAGA